MSLLNESNSKNLIKIDDKLDHWFSEENDSSNKQRRKTPINDGNELKEVVDKFFTTDNLNIIRKYGNIEDYDIFNK